MVESDARLGRHVAVAGRIDHGSGQNGTAAPLGIQEHALDPAVANDRFAGRQVADHSNAACLEHVVKDDLHPFRVESFPESRESIYSNQNRRSQKTSRGKKVQRKTTSGVEGCSVMSRTKMTAIAATSQNQDRPDRSLRSSAG